MNFLFTYTAVADLSTLLLMTFSTTVIVFTVVIYSIVIAVNFNYHLALVYRVYRLYHAMV